MTPKQQRLERLRAIEREWLVASIAAEGLEGRLRVHDIRGFRNALVHEGGEVIQAVGLREACSELCRFFSGLPHRW